MRHIKNSKKIRYALIALGKSEKVDRSSETVH